MKLLGFLAVVLGCGAFGLSRSMALSRRAACLAASAEALRYMASSLLASACPLPELVEELSQWAGPEVRGLFSRLLEAMDKLGEESFEELWKDAVYSEPSLALDESQRHILAGAGEFMGKFSSEEQSRALERCAGRLEMECRAAEEKAREGRRLYPGLGLTAGVMLAAVFL